MVAHVKSSPTFPSDSVTTEISQPCWDSVSIQEPFLVTADGPSSNICQPAMVLNLDNLLESSPAVLELEVLRMNSNELKEFEALLDYHCRLHVGTTAEFE